MTEIRRPHDHFFQHSFSKREAAFNFLQRHLPPEVRKVLDLRVLELTKDSFVDEALQDHFSDLLYQTRLVDGEEAYVYLLFEHKSYPAALVAFQLLRYMIRIWEEALQEAPAQGLRPIVPLVLYHGATKWNVRQNFGSLLRGPEALRIYWPEFNYELYDLTQYGNDELAGYALLEVALRVMKHISTGDLAEHLPGILSLLQELAMQESGLVNPGINKPIAILPYPLEVLGLIYCRTQGVPDLRHHVLSFCTRSCAMSRRRAGI